MALQRHGRLALPGDTSSSLARFRPSADAFSASAKVGGSGVVRSGEAAGGRACGAGLTATVDGVAAVFFRVCHVSSAILARLKAMKKGKTSENAAMSLSQQQIHELQLSAMRAGA